MEVAERPTTEKTISADHPCWNCLYNLRGLCPEGRCPECGEAIDVTKRPRESRWRLVLKYLSVFLACLLIVFLAGVTLWLDGWVAVTGQPLFLLSVGGIAAAVAVPVWLWTRSRVLAAAFLALLLVLLFLPFVSFTTGVVKPYHMFFKRVRNGMTQQDVILKLDREFPNRASDDRPSITMRNANCLSMILDRNDGRYNAELIIINFEDGRVVSKRYLPD